jgi:hypothetical protein
LSGRKTSKRIISDEEAVKNLLIILLLREGVDPKVLEYATGIPEMTIRGKFPMKLIKKSKAEDDINL